MPFEPGQTVMPFEPGQTVSFVPDACYGRDTDAANQPVFELNEEPKTKRERHLRGKKEDGKIGRPLFFWKAKILALYPDQSADLEIEHPRGTHRLFHRRVRYDAAQALGTWH